MNKSLNKYNNNTIKQPVKQIQPSETMSTHVLKDPNYEDIKPID